MATDLFRRFTLESILQISATKASDQRKIRSALAEQYPCLEPHWETILPKGRDLMLVRCLDQVNLVVLLPEKVGKKQVLFFQVHEGFFLPHMKLLHRYPFMLPAHRADIGACKFILGGANMMCQGLTHRDGAIAPNVPEGAAVAITVYGKRHALAVGVTLMPSDAIAAVNSGPCIMTVHHIGDGLYMLEELP